MFKNIFSRLLITYLIIVISILTVMSVIVSVLYSNYMFEEKRKSLKSAAYKVSNLTEGYLNNNVSENELNIALNTMGMLTESSIYVIKATRTDFEENKINLEEGLNEPFINSVMLDVLNGEYVYKKRQYSDKLEMSVIFTGYPLKINNKVEGAVLIFSPVSSVDSLIRNMNIIIWLAALVLLIISSVFIYFNSLRITRPLRSLDSAAKRIASGQKVDNINFKSSDEIGQLIDSFNDMKDKIEATEKMRREFIANVSHDLRTPLTSINGFVQGMLDGLIKSEQNKEYLEIIKEETGRLIALTGDILQLAKIQSNALPINKKEHNLIELCQSIINSVDTVSPGKDITIETKIDEELNIIVDRDKFKQIIVNLINNSIKYSKDKLLIQISAKKKNDIISIEIKDNGIGISQEDLPYIFEKFYRADKVRNTSEGGTGLGLDIVKGLVELHGGKIEVHSVQGSGTVIILNFPQN